MILSNESAYLLYVDRMITIYAIICYVFVFRCSTVFLLRQVAWLGLFVYWALLFMVCSLLSSCKCGHLLIYILLFQLSRGWYWGSPARSCRPSWLFLCCWCHLVLGDVIFFLLWWQILLFLLLFSFFFATTRVFVDCIFVLLWNVS